MQNKRKVSKTLAFACAKAGTAHYVTSHRDAWEGSVKANRAEGGNCRASSAHNAHSICCSSAKSACAHIDKAAACGVVRAMASCAGQGTTKPALVVQVVAPGPLPDACCAASAWKANGWTEHAPLQLLDGMAVLLGPTVAVRRGRRQWRPGRVRRGRRGRRWRLPSNAPVLAPAPVKKEGEVLRLTLGFGRWLLSWKAVVVEPPASIPTPTLLPNFRLRLV